VPSFLHSVETAFGVSIPQLKAEELERKQHPVKTLAKDLRDAAGGPAYTIAKGVVELAQHSYVSGRDAIREYHGGNTDAAIADAVEAIPILGHGINVAAGQAPATTGSYWRDLGHVVTSGATMGTVLATTAQTGLALDGLSRVGPVVRGVTGPDLGAGAADAGGTTAAVTEGAGADAATLPVDAVPPVDASPAAEREGATTATPPADVDAAPEPVGDGSDDVGSDGGGASAATPPVVSGSASEAGEAGFAVPLVDASPATTPVDAAAAPAPAGASTFESSFSQIKQAIEDSELGQRAPRALQDAVQTIFEGDPNFRLLTPGGILEVPPNQFFLQPTQIQEELQRILIDPTTGETMGAQPGLDVFPQGNGGGGLVMPPDAHVESAPEMVTTPEGQTAESQQDAGVSAGADDAGAQPKNTEAANPQTTNTPASPNARASGTQPANTQPTANTNTSSSSPSTAGTAATSPSGGPTLNIGKQAKHSANLIKNRNPEPGRSLLTADPYEMLKYAGKGQPVGPIPRGLPGFKERVDVGRVIGDYVTPGHPPVPSTKIMIVYAKHNTVHIYPVEP